jgi:hypothetical protein
MGGNFAERRGIVAHNAVHAGSHSGMLLEVYLDSCLFGAMDKGFAKQPSDFALARIWLASPLAPMVARLPVLCISSFLVLGNPSFSFRYRDWVSHVEVSALEWEQIDKR